MVGDPPSRSRWLVIRPVQPLAREVTGRAGQHEPKFMPGIAPAVEPKCGECGWNWNMGGPYWLEPLHDTNFAQ
eukprot:3221432-Pyramimonas_sp.AAC.1